MKSKLKQFAIFLLSLFLYVIPSILFRTDRAYYSTLKGAFLPPIVFIIVWSVLFLILSYLHMHFIVHRNLYDKGELRKYFIYAILNYVLIVMFLVSFNVFKNLFFSYVSTLLCALTSIILFMQVLLLDKKIALWLLPYNAWTIFATIYSILIYLKN